MVLVSVLLDLQELIGLVYFEEHNLSTLLVVFVGMVLYSQVSIVFPKHSRIAIGISA